MERGKKVAVCGWQWTQQCQQSAVSSQCGFDARAVRYSRHCDRSSAQWTFGRNRDTGMNFNYNN